MKTAPPNPVQELFKLGSILLFMSIAAIALMVFAVGT